MRSLFSGVSGLKVHQTKMDVIGNNISNVNTIGFKASSVTFSDVLYQTTQSASGPNAATGLAGRNAMQIGLGANVASITASMTVSGASQRTDNPFDFMIEGSGFFVVNNGGSNYFTKAGTFGIDAQGTLCTPNGAKVMGWQVDPNDPTKTVADAVTPLRIMTPENLFTTPEATKEIHITGNIDSKDTQLTSDTGRLVLLSFFDNLGNSYTAEVKVQKAGDPTDEYAVSLKDIKDSTGQSIFVIKKVDEEGKVFYEQSAFSVSLGADNGFDVEEFDPETGKVKLTGESILLKFDGANGKFVSIGEGDGDTPPKSIPLTIAGTPNPFEAINVDFSSITMFNTSGKTNLEAEKGSLEGLGAGKMVGNMTGVAVDTSGKIFGKYDNGDSKLLGQIVVATFANPSGLEAVGNNMFAATQNSGDFDGIGKDPSLGGGSITAGVVEMSNVDLSAQFTDMITTQRGFQANSRIITTSDSLLEELINLKR